LQLLLCGFDICLFLFDRTAKIDPTEFSTCRGSFGGFESTCFQLDWAARIKTTGISYFSIGSIKQQNQPFTANFDRIFAIFFMLTCAYQMKCLTVAPSRNMIVCCVNQQCFLDASRPPTTLSSLLLWSLQGESRSFSLKIPSFVTHLLFSTNSLMPTTRR
jgi:hypothetical protein